MTPERINLPPELECITVLSLEPTDFQISLTVPAHLRRRTARVVPVLICATILGAVLSFRLLKDYDPTYGTALCLGWGILAFETSLLTGRAIQYWTRRTRVAARDGRLEILETDLLGKTCLLECTRVKRVEVAFSDVAGIAKPTSLVFVCDAPFPEFPVRCRRVQYQMFPFFPVVIEPPQEGMFHCYRIDFQLPECTLTWLRDSLVVAAIAQGMLA